MGVNVAYTHAHTSAIHINYIVCCRYMHIHTTYPRAYLSELNQQQKRAHRYQTKSRSILRAVDSDAHQAHSSLWTLFAAHSKWWTFLCVYATYFFLRLAVLLLLAASSVSLGCAMMLPRNGLGKARPRVSHACSRLGRARDIRCDLSPYNTRALSGTRALCVHNSIVCKDVRARA